jgi:hypothetical protein
MDTFFRDWLRPLTPGPFRLGDRVRFLWGLTPVEGIVVEDRGNCGAEGERVYRVRVRLSDVSEPIETEEPADELTLVARARTRAAQRLARKLFATEPPSSCPYCEGARFVDPLARGRSAENPGPFREGDRVRLLWGLTPVEGIVIEDRGERGREGRRFYCVRIQLGDVSEPMEDYLPAEDLTLVARAPTRSRRRRQR